ncbi:hypothetical protein N7478_011012 [Penicillium angulare]|uniref:uncharacterized protein n=1 Tax=Penicillium angulare TaxID=116970 RepID=UPI002541A076|nr:uncharacterized protein N7478_011012 [Penicillium angulare]KAJ5263407.1 hypothetical protein N7478_011012 [Penicillium angulare]
MAADIWVPVRGKRATHDEQHNFTNDYLDKEEDYKDHRYYSEGTGGEYSIDILGKFAFGT